MQSNGDILKLYVYILQQEMLDVSGSVIHSHSGTHLFSISVSPSFSNVLPVSLALCLT